jgi:hypothetical protein
MPGEASLAYTSGMADTITLEDLMQNPPENPISAALDLRDAGQAEARWWAAVLAQGQGWKASLSLGGDSFFAPWSIQLQPGYPFTLLRDSDLQNGAAAENELMPPPASFSEALRFLDRFGLARNIVNQSHAAPRCSAALPTNGYLQLYQGRRTATSRIHSQAQGGNHRRIRPIDGAAAVSRCRVRVAA